ncbi:MAG: formylglycine-generating enzyme family protein [Fidelibacterota bacterium]
MKIMTRILLALISVALLSAQTASVTNVTAAQRTDGSKIVDIYYDLGEDITFTTFSVSLEISFDGGVSFTNTSHATGDIGDGIVAGPGKHIEWFLGSEYGGMYSDQTVIQVIATGRFIDVPFSFVVVPAGNFTYGNNDEIRNISYDYEIMQFEVTNAEYAAFLIDALDAGVVWMNGGDEVQGFYAGDEHYGPGNYSLHYRWESRIHWNGTTFIVDEGYGNHPVTGVTWFGAYKFASYYGLRLPTEEEWEKAARDTTGWEYPWGDVIDSSNANYRYSGDPWEGGDNWDIFATTPVGFYNGQNYNGFQTTDSPSPFGAYDMAGNVKEWTVTWDQNEPSRRIWRSGAFNHNQWDIQSYRRWSEQPNYSRRDKGFRCVRDISTARAKYLLKQNKASKRKTRQ